MSIETITRRLTAPDIRARKGGEPIVSLTAYHAHTAAIVDRHADLVQALAMHDYEASVAALEAEYDLFTPLLEECQYHHPTFFESPH